jgi:ADP-ribose pyrophosphatase
MSTLSTKTVYTSRYLKVIQKVIQRNGKTFTKDFIERVSSVCILPYNEKGEVYLGSMYRDAHEKRILELIAGKIEGTDDPLTSAKRELIEEAGLTAKKWQKIAEWELSGNMQSKIHLFFVTDLTEGKQQLDIDEEIEIIKMPFEKVLEKIYSGELILAPHIAALLLFDKMRKEGKL